MSDAKLISFDVDISVEDKMMKAMFEKLIGAAGVVEVGFFPDKYYTKGRNKGKPITVEDVSNWNQEGEHKREFMQEVATSTKTKKALKKAAESITKRGLSHHAALTVLGKTVKKELENKIKNGPNRPNTKETIARKRSNTPLVETGTMGNSVKSRVIRKGKAVRGLGRYYRG